SLVLVQLFSQRLPPAADGNSETHIQTLCGEKVYVVDLYWVLLLETLNPAKEDSDVELNYHFSTMSAFGNNNIQELANCITLLNELYEHNILNKIRNIHIAGESCLVSMSS
ncbi:hypothetical protein STEG23_022234, partial [Scotinomys teguina]